MSLASIGVWGIGIIIVLGALLISLMFRRVVSTNMVHIVQSRRKTTPYGTGQTAGNVYYAWPSSIPFFGVTVIRLPVSNFDLSLKDYDAYDIDRVPFMVDVASFFRISDTAKAAERVSDTNQLHEQLLLITQGAVRKVLAGDKIDNIMLERSKFGAAFTAEVTEQLLQWGVEPVKSMELMDIRDGRGSQVISNIMAKKTSFIEMQSRTEVAGNTKVAETAEIEARQVVAVRQQEADQLVGQRTADKEKAVGVSQELSRQEVLTQAKTTKVREMEVSQVQQVRAAEIEREKQIVAAEQDKRTRVIIADGTLEAQRKEAEGILAIGQARASAEQAMQMAPVAAAITLAKEIGTNEGYQKYLAMIEAIKAYITVGSEQARALQNADVKVISNSGTATGGVKNVMELFSSKGGTELGAMIEALAQTPMGQAAMSALGINSDSKPAAENAASEAGK